MNLRQQAAGVKSAMQAIVDGATAESRDLTDDEATEIEAKAAEYKELTEKAERAEKAAQTVASLASAPVVEVVEPGADDLKGLTITERFIKSDAFQAFRKNHPSGVDGGTPIRVEAKGLGGISDLIGKKELTTSTGQFVSQQRLPGYRNELLDEPLAFLELITTGNTAASYIEYARVVSETDSAAIVAEGALKPLSEVVTDTADAKAFTYADGFVVTNQTLADDGALVAFMESRVRFHVMNKVVDIILNGAGTATEPAGLMNITGTQAQVFDTDVLTTLARAIEKVQAVQATPQAIVLNPSDAWGIRLLQNNSGDYYAGGPFSAAPFTPWGVRVVESNRVAAGTAIVGNFSQIQWLQRDPLSVLAFNQHEDFARRNKTYVRAELRGLQMFYAPRELVIADLTAV